LLWASVGNLSVAARWATALADRSESSSRESVSWRAVAARWFWASGEEVRARDLCLEAHKQCPSDDYLAAMALRLTIAGREFVQCLDVATRRADAADNRMVATQWLVLAAAMLEAAGAEEQSRRALEGAVERDPDSSVVRAAALAASRWRGDAVFRGKLAAGALLDGVAGAEELSLGVELSLVRAFVDHDHPGAIELLDRLAAIDPTISPVSLLRAITLGAVEGADSESAASAWQAVLSSLPSHDPLRVGVELEVARALGASAATREQAAAVRDLAEGDRPHLVAPRLLAMLDAIQRDGREDIPGTLLRVAERGEGALAGALRGAAVTSLRARGHIAELHPLVAEHNTLAAAIMAAAELTPSLERAEEHAAVLQRRVALSGEGHRTSLEHASANWASLARKSEEALATAEQVLKRDPDDVVALDVTRVSGRRLRRWSAVATACAALAKRVRDPARAAAFWEEAGVVASDELHNASMGEPWLRAALEAAPERDVAYRTLKSILESRGDTSALEALVTRRLASLKDSKTRAEALWEQARLRRALGRREGALESAVNVVALDPDHVAALALVAEIHAASGRLAETADALAALGRCKEAPKAQRLVALNGAVVLFDRRLARPDRALEQLDVLLAEGEADDAALERGVVIASAAKLWDSALMFAQKAADRAEKGPAHAAALLRVVEICRDGLRDATRARENARKAHEAYPEDLRVLRIRAEVGEASERSQYARMTIDALREAMRTDVTLDRASGLSEAAKLAGDGVLQHLSGRLAVALGSERVVASVEEPTGTSLRDPSLLLRYRHPRDNGSAVLLLETLLPDLAELCGASTDALKVGWTEKVRGAHATRTAIAPYLRAAGCPEFELYVGGSDPQRIAVVPGDPVAVVLGSAVTFPLSATAKFELMRRLLLTLRGVSALAYDDPATMADRSLAALLHAELPVVVSPKRFESQLKTVSRAVSRRVRRAIAESGRGLATDPNAWESIARAARAMLSTARRGALAVSGDVAIATREMVRAEALRDRPVSDVLMTETVGNELALYSVSDALAQVMRELGTERREGATGVERK
jgi:tetratricopeptide (TPR) repeat protein